MHNDNSLVVYPAPFWDYIKPHQTEKAKPCAALWAYRASLDCQWCRGTELNCRHGDFQSPALPTELPRRHDAPCTQCRNVWQAFFYGRRDFCHGDSRAGRFGALPAPHNVCPGKICRRRWHTKRQSLEFFSARPIRRKKAPDPCRARPYRQPDGGGEGLHASCILGADTIFPGATGQVLP